MISGKVLVKIKIILKDEQQRTDMFRVLAVRNAKLIANAPKSDQTADSWGQEYNHSYGEYNELKGIKCPWCIMKNISTHIHTHTHKSKGKKGRKMLTVWICKQQHTKIKVIKNLLEAGSSEGKRY